MTTEQQDAILDALLTGVKILMEGGAEDRALAALVDTIADR